MTGPEVFRRSVALLEGNGFDYAVAGGLATQHWTGRPPSLEDIDLVVAPDDAPEILKMLSGEGYEVTEMEHSWLHKAQFDGVKIDLLIELKNGARLDGPFLDRRSQVSLLGARAYVLSAEDQVVALAAAASRDTIGNYWFSAIDIMANTDLDWDYVVMRSRGCPERILSVLYFALSEGVPVTKGIAGRLEEMLRDI